MLEIEDYRRKMLAETSAFIEWGLRNPDKVPRIPRRRVGEGGFSKAMRVAFWGRVFSLNRMAPRQLLKRFLWWALVR
jgi:hypothetical protein